jgi:hypothetical protein
MQKNERHSHYIYVRVHRGRHVPIKHMIPIVQQSIILSSAYIYMYIGHPHPGPVVDG